MLEARHLAKRYFGTAVVRDVNFTLRRGEVLGYLGPNGSGKSTTIKMLVGLLEPSEGGVFLEGQRIDADPLAYRRRLGYVPEEPILYAFQSGREYLEFVWHLRELDPRRLDQKLGALFELFNLSHAADQDISAYSKGMKQRLMLMAALMHNPDVIILDEPDSGLDVTTTMILRQLVIALARKGKAVLYSSHVLDLVEKACSRVIVIYRGQVVADDHVSALQKLAGSGSLEEVFAQLTQREDPAKTAADIADVVVADA